LTGAEGASNNDQFGYLSSFDSDGFTSTAGSAGAGSNLYFNNSGTTYVAWQWKANGTGVSNTAGSITSTVSAGVTQGFSVVTYTGTGANATVGHGLGVAPKMVIVKSRTESLSWYVLHGTASAGYLDLATTGARVADPAMWASTEPTSSVFSLGVQGYSVNNSGATYVAYCFAEVAGYSKFGSYTGNGSADGPFVYCGFRPAYVMVKRTDGTGIWLMHDTSRGTSNVVTPTIEAQTSNAEFSFAAMDILSSGFKIRLDSANTAVNASGGSYIFMAFAENPFKNSLAR
jgi:hypothetical protein